MGDKKLEELERELLHCSTHGNQMDAALGAIMERTTRSSTLDLATARRTLEEIHLIARKARGFED
jgi:hypothetical protein